jgi:hypothetical protein
LSPRALQFQASTKLLAVIGVPSWKVQFSFSLIVHVWLSSDSIDSAISFSGAAVSGL